MNNFQYSIKDSVNKSPFDSIYPPLFTSVHDSIRNPVYLLLFRPIRNRLLRFVRVEIDDSVRSKYE